MMISSMDCDRFEARLGEYLEGDLDADARVALEAHRASCLHCSALLRDLETIRRNAAAMPELVPSRDLWEGIAARIDQEVVAAPVFGSTPAMKLAGDESSPRVRRGRYITWGAAAAALVAVTSGVTYYATMARVRASTTSTLAATPSRDSANSAVTLAPTPVVGSATAPAPLGTPGGGIQTVAARTRVPAATTYDREIFDLRQVLQQRRNDLDPATVAIVENSLNTIDKAIAEARIALAHDPASAFLKDQLNKALEKKLGLLRTVALLPARA